MANLSNVTQLLVDWGNGNRGALDELTPHVYRELHVLARSYLSRERPNQTLQPTALINEVYLRLIDQSQPKLESRSHFYGIAARLMRQILVDYARSNRAAKRGGGVVPITLVDANIFVDREAPDIVELDDALGRLAQVNERMARTVELRYFGGMTREEVAGALGLTVATVKRDLRLAQAWLRHDLSSHT
jgi:RNA polymerase sigma factor (TIGR02999 family)